MCGDHIGRGSGFVEECARAGLNGGEARNVRVLAGEEDHLGSGPDAANGGGGVGPGAVGQPEVDQHDVRIELCRRRQAFGHGADVAHHRHVRLIVDQGGQALGYNSVVFHDEDAGRRIVAVSWFIQRRGWFFGEGHISITVLIA